MTHVSDVGVQVPRIVYGVMLLASCVLLPSEHLPIHYKEAVEVQMSTGSLTAYE